MRAFATGFLLAAGCASKQAPRATGAPTALPPADCSVSDAVEIVHHAIDLSVHFEPPSIAGRGDVHVRAKRAVSAVALDAHALRVSEIRSGGTSLRFRRSDERVCVELPRVLAAGEATSIRVAWDVATNRRVPYFAGARVWAGYDAASWMPTRQDPATRATLVLRVTAPSGAKVVGPGRARARASNDAGATVHEFALDRPSPPFLYAFAAGDFDEAESNVDGVNLRALGPPGADLQRALAITAPMLRFAAAHTGAPLPSSEYTQVFVDGDGVAQEAAGFALLAASALDEVRKEPTEDWMFAHELSHQWFAWLVPCADFSDFWLNEGFATFMTAAMKEERWGRALYERELRLWRERSAKVHAEGRDAPVALSSPSGPTRNSPRDSELQARGVTYARGALVLHKLRTELGDATFWEGVRRYVADRAGKSARTEDLRRAFESASGRDLRRFFDQWVYAPTTEL